MGIYYVIEALLLFGLLLYGSVQFSSVSNKRILYSFFVFVFIFFACFRDKTVGQDTYSYMRLFELISNTSWSNLLFFSRYSGYEIGYVLYNKFLSLLSHNSQIITIGNSLLLISLSASFIHRECLNPVFGLFLFYTLGLYQAGFNIVSSLIAAYFVFCGIDEIRKKKLIKFLFYVLFASLFHSAAMLLVVLYFFQHIKINMRRIFLILGGGIFFTLFLSQLLSLLNRFIPSKYLGYMSRSADNGMILLFHLLILGLIFIVHVSATKNISFNDDETIRIHLWAVIFEIVFLMFGMRINIFTRVAYLFMPSLPVYIDKSIGDLELSGNKYFLYLSLILAIGLQYVIRLQINNIGGSIPYSFCF